MYELPLSRIEAHIGSKKKQLPSGTYLYECECRAEPVRMRSKATGIYKWRMCAEHLWKD